MISYSMSFRTKQIKRLAQLIWQYAFEGSRHQLAFETKKLEREIQELGESIHPWI